VESIELVVVWVWILDMGGRRGAEVEISLEDLCLEAGAKSWVWVRVAS
jgi:hypothetical protein